LEQGYDFMLILKEWKEREEEIENKGLRIMRGSIIAFLNFSYKMRLMVWWSNHTYPIFTKRGHVATSVMVPHKQSHSIPLKRRF